MDKVALSTEIDFSLIFKAQLKVFDFELADNNQPIASIFNEIVDLLPSFIENESDEVVGKFIKEKFFELNNRTKLHQQKQQL